MFSADSGRREFIKMSGAFVAGWAIEPDLKPATIERVAMPQAATIIIAAADSLHKNRADYTCDGVADQLIIQRALDELPAVGGKILLLEGTFNTSGDLIIPANATLEGQGWSTVINASGYSLNNAIVVNGNNVKIYNLKVQIAPGSGRAGVLARPNVVLVERRSSIRCESLWLVGDLSVPNEVADSRQDCICFIGTTRSLVVNCRLTSYRRNGVYLSKESSYNIVRSNFIQTEATPGSWGILTVNDSNHNLIQGNIIEGPGNTDCIRIDYSSHNLVDGNTGRGVVETGIFLRQSPSNTITGNIFVGNTLPGIFLVEGSHGCVITNNSIVENKEMGIYIIASSYCVILGNYCYRNRGDGMRLLNSGYNVISGNICRGNDGRGIYIFSDRHEAGENSIMGNICKENTDVGIKLAGGGSRFNKVVGNNARSKPEVNNIVDEGTDNDLGFNSG